MKKATPVATATATATADTAATTADATATMATADATMATADATMATANAGMATDAVGHFMSRAEIDAEIAARVAHAFTNHYVHDNDDGSLTIIPQGGPLAGVPFTFLPEGPLQEAFLNDPSANTESYFAYYNWFDAGWVTYGLDATGGVTVVLDSGCRDFTTDRAACLYVLVDTLMSDEVLPFQPLAQLVQLVQLAQMAPDAPAAPPME